MNPKHIDISLLTRYFSGEASAEEQAAVQNWMAESEAHAREYRQLESVWTTLGKTSAEQEIDVDAEWQYLQGKLQQHATTNSSSIGRFILQIAATIILLVSLGIVGYQFLSGKSTHTDLTQTEVIKLPDGTRITLNGNSKLRYPKNFGSTSRTLKLKGEAYFEVARDTSLPFIVELGDAQVRVLGTAFNIKARKDSEHIEVTVTEGIVSLSERKQQLKKVVAGKGEKAVYDKHQKTVRKTANANRNFLSWKTRKLQFENDDLSTVVTTLQQVYHQDIRLRGNNQESCTLTAVFDNEELSTVLRILENTLDLRIEKSQDIIYLDSHACSQ